MSEEDKLEYELWRDHLNQHRQKASYSAKRIDLLTISISGAGLYISLNLMNKLKGDGILEKILILLACIFLIRSIFLNFRGQIKAKKSNDNEKEYASKKMDKLRGFEIKQEVFNSINKKVKDLNKIVDKLDKSSRNSMFVGLVILIFCHVLIFLCF